MLDLSNRSTKTMPVLLSSRNWERDIEDVEIKTCSLEEDPSGYRVIYYYNRGEEPDAHDESLAYELGASFLDNRLERLNRAGFKAPMTKKAINIISQKRLRAVAQKMDRQTCMVS